MGNRCVITTRENYKNNGVGVYLHWNGGRDSVEGFLEYMKLRGFRSPKEDESYAWARLCQVIGNYFGGGLSIGVDKTSHLDTCGDNGVYLIDGWNIVGRVNYDGPEQREYDLNEMLEAIDDAQPASEKVGKDFLSAAEVPVKSLRIGDKVFLKDFVYDRYFLCEVAGFGEHRCVNGRNVSGVPYVYQYDSGPDNINNYLFDQKYRVIRHSEENADQMQGDDPEPLF